MPRLFKIILLLTPLLNTVAFANSSVPHSVLASGKWIRMAVTADGVYRIDYSALKDLGLTNPSKPRLYSNNAGQLSYYNTDNGADDLKEMSFYISGNDPVLDDGEYILFYGQAPHRWIFDETARKYDFLRHNYSDTSFYFITSGDITGKIISTKDSSLIPNSISVSGDALFIHEKDIKNLKKSGREWFQPVSAINGITIDPGLDDIITSGYIRYRIRVAARAAINTVFSFIEGSVTVSNMQVPAVNLYNYTGTYANIVEYADSVMPLNSSPVYELKYNNNGTTSENAGWLDYISLHARSLNRFDGTFKKIQDYRIVRPGGVTEFRIEANTADIMIWDVTEQHNTMSVPFRRSGETVSFKDSSVSLRTYVTFSPAAALIPVFRQSPVPNQDLHGSPPADMIIVTHPLFLDYAVSLGKIHYDNDGLESLIVTPEQIYNEYSGGVPDIVAIRNFVRMKYRQQLNTGQNLKYLLLFGDGSYENKTPPPANPNFIPTYQSQNSNIVVSSFTSDDFYGLLEENEGESEGTEDIGIGRLPVNDTSQAALIISKIRKYTDPSSHGEWKNMICLVADDEDGNTHLADTENLAEILSDSVPSFNIDKIYLDSYRQTTTANGQTYPQVNQAINNRINSGCLIFNYVGHGSENGLAHEGILAPSDIRSWQNDKKLPLFVTATCEFSRFDDMEFNGLTGSMDQKTSAGELALLGSEAGAIALMSTTRVVYSAPNAFLNRNIFNFAFQRDAEGKALTLGEIIRLAKNNSGSGINKRNFTLLGDPALRLAYPWHGRLVTDSVINITDTESSDTLKALSVITVSGHAEEINGSIMNDFNGIVLPVVYDKETRITTLANDGGTSVEFPVRNNILFSGKTTAENGRFSFTFIVPRDIDYSPGPGKISYYASDDILDINGSVNDIIVGGFSDNSSTDSEGPEIELFMNDTLFREGGLTSENPLLIAVIEDPGGINTTGSGIGHDITMFLDNNANNTLVMNEYFENDFNNYKKGKLTYNLTGLGEGEHSLTLKAWDNYNNSSSRTISFRVGKDNIFMIVNLMNYPNPFFDKTTFEFQHNRPDEELDITIKIFSLSGSLVRSEKTRYPAEGFVIRPMIWDGKDDKGAKAGRGLYIYTVTVRTIKGESATASGRLIIL